MVLFDTACSIMHRAVDLDQRGKLDKALSHYHQALRLFALCSHDEVREDVWREQLWHRLGKYRARVEELSGHLETRQLSSKTSSSSLSSSEPSARSPTLPHPHLNAHTAFGW